jgi:glycerol-3-phosphate dehydrogenase
MPLTHSPTLLKTQVLIIGGGITGAGLARDLTMRGVDCILAEKRDFNAGASGGNHGLLHSGARYVDSDPAAACECQKENRILKQIVPHCIDNVGGLFVAVKGDNENYVADFPLLCRQCGIDAQPLSLDQTVAMEPALSKRLIAAYAVNDAAVDPFRLTLDNIAHAQQLGALLLCYSRVSGFAIRSGRIQGVSVVEEKTNRSIQVEARVVVNAAGAWAGQVAALAGINLPMRFSKGSLLVTQSRLAHRVINRLRKATDADILVPGGTVSILGTTSIRVNSPENIFPEIEEVDFMIDEGSAMLPELSSTRYIRSYCGVRPLVNAGDGNDDRNISRGFTLVDHTEQGVGNFITITGGKLTTYRLMAEKTADLVCRRLHHDAPCLTAQTILPDSRAARWTTAGLAPKEWISAHTPQDQLLCECEMVSQSVLSDLITATKRQYGFPLLTAISRRSRIGKGPCQGTFCSQRVVADLYNRGDYKDRQGIDNLRAFLQERWRGQHPLFWDTALVQAELLEAMYCGMCSLELSEGISQKRKV